MYIYQSLDVEDTVFVNNLVHIKGTKDQKHCVKPLSHYSSQLKALHFSFPGSLNPSLGWLGPTEKIYKKAEIDANNYKIYKNCTFASLTILSNHNHC